MNNRSFVKKEIIISNATKDRVEACKTYIERKYAKQIQEEQSKKQNWDLLFNRMAQLNLNQVEQDLIKKEILRKESQQMRERRVKLSIEDFQPLAIIGRGAFGEVRLCRHLPTKQIVAVKKMKKSEMIFKNQIGHVTNERQVLESAKGNQWIVEMKCSFQDDRFLYLVMEYLAGGDLMTLLIKKDTFPENEAKFYMAELVLAVDSVHKLNFIHRDLKPDNVLLDNEGHLKLSDFGLCKHSDIKVTDIDSRNYNQPMLLKKSQKSTNRRRELAFSTVGTPDYIAPEVFAQKGYDHTVDWWSVGVIMYEMLIGYPPFFSDDASNTCQKITTYKKHFSFPDEPRISREAQDLIIHLIADREVRYGQNGIDEIISHDWFKGVNFDRVRQQRAPYPPKIYSDIDTQNFDKYDEEEPWITENRGKERKKELNFYGYTYKQDSFVERTPLVQALQELEQTKPSVQRRNTILLNNSKPSTPNTYERLSTLQNEKFTFPTPTESKVTSRQGTSPALLSKSNKNSQNSAIPIKMAQPSPIIKNVAISPLTKTIPFKPASSKENVTPLNSIPSSHASSTAQQSTGDQTKNFIFSKIQQSQNQQPKNGPPKASNFTQQLQAFLNQNFNGIKRSDSNIYNSTQPKQNWVNNENENTQNLQHLKVIPKGIQTPQIRNISPLTKNARLQ